jgi:bacterioferritin
MGFDLDRSELDHGAYADQAASFATSARSEQTNREAVLNLLNEAMATELMGALRYRRHYFVADGSPAQTIKKEFLVHAVEAQRYADKLAERIVELGGEPDFDPASLPMRSRAHYADGGTLPEIIESDLSADRTAIRSYRELAAYLGNHDDTTLILLDEIFIAQEEHAEELSRMVQALRDSEVDETAEVEETANAAG